MRKTFALIGPFSALLMTSGCVGYVESGFPPPPPRGPLAMERADVDAPGYHVAPKPNPRRTASRSTSYDQYRRGHETPAETKKPPASTDSASGSEKAQAPVRTADEKPLTPAEIRAAIPLQKVNNPQHTLSDAQIKSVWGEVVGKVRGVNVSGGTLKAVEADVGAKKVVRIDPARLKYVKSRNVILTTMSKPDLEKLPNADRL